MNKNISFTIIFLGIFFQSFSQYLLNWQKTDSLEKAKQYEKALQLSQKLYKQATQSNHIEEKYKSIIYQIKYKSLLSEPISDIIIFTENEAGKAKLPLKNILHSLIVDLYLNYYQNNYRRIEDNICIENLACAHLQDWSINRLRKEIMHHILLSLSGKEKLEAIKTRDLNKMIVQSKKSTDKHANVYDFLAFKALDFLENKQWKPLNKHNDYSFPNRLLLLPADEFIKQSISTNDSLSPQYLKLKIYKELIKEHLQAKNTNALIQIDLRRFKPIKPKGNFYVKSIENIIKKYEKYPACSEFYYLQAKYYYQKDSSDTQKSNNNRLKALSICNAAINKYPESTGAKQCAYLKSKILIKSLSFNIKEVVTAKDSFDIDLNYRNIDTVYIKLAKIEENKLADLRNRYFGKELYQEILKASKTINISTHILPESLDYYPHTTKIRLKNQAAGRYVIFVANNKHFRYENNISAYADFTASKISYIYKKLPDGSLEYYIIDRKSGSPIENVQVKIYEQKENYESGKIEKILISSLLTGKNGYFIIKAEQNTSLKNLYLEFRKGKDVLISKQPVLLYPVNSNNQEKIKIEIITDKNHYKTGEILYFKAIVLKTDNSTTNLLPQTKIPLIIKANKSIVSEKIYTSNEFGSISSQFKIPENIKSGELEIYTPYGSKFVKINILQVKKEQKISIPIRENEKEELFKLTKSILNDTLTLTINTKEKKLNLLYELKTAHKTISKWITVSKNQEEIKLPLNEETSVKIILTSIKNSTLVTKTEEFNRACLNKKLRIEIKHFKEENISGSDVSWEISVHDMQNNPVQSEVLLFLSEDSSSLLNFNRLSSSICPKNDKYLWKIFSNKQQKAIVLSQFLNQFSPLPYKSFSYLNLYGFRFPKQSYKYANSKVLFKDKRDKKVADLPSTEFFFPDLKSDAKSSINLRVNFPKTTNKQYLNILAVSKNSQFGYIVKPLIIKKMLKIESEKPDFYRAGDLPLISTKLINNTYDTLKGNVRLLLYQNGFKEILIENEKSGKNFIIPPKQTISVFWKIKIPENMNVLRYKIEAKTSQYIDIEQNNIKILNIRIPVNKNRNTSVRKQISSINDTVKIVKDTKIFINKSLQIVNNLSNTLSENVVDLFLNYFTNTIEVQYFKNAEDKRLQNSYLLSRFQNKSGSWSWFQNMPEDFEISTYIVTGLGRMQKTALIDIKKDLQIRKILLRSIYYLDEYLYKKYRQGNFEFSDYNILLNYFYARSYFQEIPVPATYKKANEFYKNYLKEKSKKFKFAEKLMFAIIAKRYHWQIETNIESRIEKLKNKSLNNENAALYIEYLNEYQKSKELINQYILNLDFSQSENKKIAASTVYILLLNKQFAKNTSDKFALTQINTTKNHSKDLKIRKELYKNANGKLLKLRDKDQLILDDTITVKIKIKSKKPLKYLLISDNYPALFQPFNIQEKTIKDNQLIYYQNQNTGSLNFYLYKIHKGKNTIEYKAVVKHKGIYKDQAVFIRQVYGNENSLGKEHIRSTTW